MNDINKRRIDTALYYGLIAVAIAWTFFEVRDALPHPGKQVVQQEPASLSCRQTLNRGQGCLNSSNVPPRRQAI